VQADVAARIFQRHYEKNPDAMTHICQMAVCGARSL
jgi:hypothetical protein